MSFIFTLLRPLKFIEIQILAPFTSVYGLKFDSKVRYWTNWLSNSCEIHNATLGQNVHIRSRSVLCPGEEEIDHVFRSEYTSLLQRPQRFGAAIPPNCRSNNSTSATATNFNSSAAVRIRSFPERIEFSPSRRRDAITFACTRRRASSRSFCFVEHYSARRAKASRDTIPDVPARRT